MAIRQSNGITTAADLRGQWRFPTHTHTPSQGLNDRALQTIAVQFWGCQDEGTARQYVLCTWVRVRHAPSRDLLGNGRGMGARGAWKDIHPCCPPPPRYRDVCAGPSQMPVNKVFGRLAGWLMKREIFHVFFCPVCF